MPIGVVVWDKAISGLKEVWRKRSAESTGERCRQEEDIIAGSLLQSWDETGRYCERIYSNTLNYQRDREAPKQADPNTNY